MGLARLWPRQQLRRLLDLTNGELQVPEWDADFNQPWMPDSEKEMGSKSAMRRGRHGWVKGGVAGRARSPRETTGAKNLCLAGGVALNCVANGRIVREAGFDNIWIQRCRWRQWDRDWLSNT